MLYILEEKRDKTIKIIYHKKNRKIIHHSFLNPFQKKNVKNRIMEI